MSEVDGIHTEGLLEFMFVLYPKEKQLIPSSSLKTSD